MEVGGLAAEGGAASAPLTPADVARIVDEHLGPPLSMDHFGWIDLLTREQAIAECEKRGLELGGIVPVLRQRLRKYERTLYEALGPRGSIGPVLSDDELRRLSRITISASAGAEAPGEQSRGHNGAMRRTSTPTGRGLFAADGGGYGFRAREGRAESPRRRGGGETRSANEALKILRQWSVSFSGVRGADADAFLERIREGRELAAVRDQDLLSSLPFVLGDVALVWFRAKRSNWRTWADFERAFCSRFAAPDFQWELTKEIMRRTQGEDEPVADFLACMLGLFARLEPPWPLDQRLACAHGNLLPRYQLTVRRGDFNDFDMLEALVAESETRFASFNRYRPPPSPEGSLLPSLACRAPARGTRKKAPVSAAAVTEADWALETERPRGEKETRDDGTRVSAAVELAAETERSPRGREPGSGESRRETRTEKAPEKGKGEKSSAPAPRERDGNRAAGKFESRRRREEGRGGEQTRPREARGNCWRCDKAGHFARDCKEPPRSQCCAGCRCREQTVVVPAEGAGNEPGRT